MFKAVCTFTLLLFSCTAFTPIARTQEAPPDDLPGVCHAYNQAGYLIVDETGSLVALTDYCERQHTLSAASSSSTPSNSSTPSSSSTPSDSSAPNTSLFWQAFEETANSEAIATANTLTPEEVVAYGSSICPFLEQGGTLRELRTLQGDGDLPRGFEVAVTVAAIHAYCPTYRSELGR